MRIWEATFTFDHFGSNTKPAIYSANNVSGRRHITDWTGLNFDGCQLGLLDFKWKPICDIYSQRLLAGKSQCYVNSTPVRSLTCPAWKICLLGLKYCISMASVRIFSQGLCENDWGRVGVLNHMFHIFRKVYFPSIKGIWIIREKPQHPLHNIFSSLRYKMQHFSIICLKIKKLLLYCTFCWVVYLYYPECFQ